MKEASRGCGSSFLPKLLVRVANIDSLLCVGIDPPLGNDFGHTASSLCRVCPSAQRVHECSGSLSPSGFPGARAVEPQEAKDGKTTVADEERQVKTEGLLEYRSAAADQKEVPQTPLAESPSEPRCHPLWKFCAEIVDATQHVAACYKPNVAFFEAWGPDGLSVLKEVCSRLIPSDVPILLDCKRGDIETTAEAYAQACFGIYGADAVTVSPYMGFDVVPPFLYWPPHFGVSASAKPPITSIPSASETQTSSPQKEACSGALNSSSASCCASPSLSTVDASPMQHMQCRSGKGVFVLCKTSNKGSEDLQTLVNRRALADRKGTLPTEQTEEVDELCPMFVRVAEVVRALNDKAVAENKQGGAAVGLVVGATDCHALCKVRSVAPEVWILSPGVGAQGGNLEDCVRSGLRKDGSGLLISVSRGIAAATNMRKAAEDLRERINRVRRTVAAEACLEAA